MFNNSFIEIVTIFNFFFIFVRGITVSNGIIVCCIVANNAFIIDVIICNNAIIVSRDITNKASSVSFTAKWIINDRRSICVFLQAINISF